MTTAAIRINMDTVAFDDDAPNGGCATELGRILRELSTEIERGELPPVLLLDLNGESVGSFTVEQDENRTLSRAATVLGKFVERLERWMATGIQSGPKGKDSDIAELYEFARNVLTDCKKAGVIE